jgi:hypothetical protein
LTLFFEGIGTDPCRQIVDQRTAGFHGQFVFSLDQILDVALVVVVIHVDFKDNQQKIGLPAALQFGGDANTATSRGECALWAVPARNLWKHELHGNLLYQEFGRAKQSQEKCPGQMSRGWKQRPLEAAAAP